MLCPICLLPKDSAYLCLQAVPASIECHPAAGSSGLGAASTNGRGAADTALHGSRGAPIATSSTQSGTQKALGAAKQPGQGRGMGVWGHNKTAKKAAPVKGAAQDKGKGKAQTSLYGHDRGQGTASTPSLLSRQLNRILGPTAAPPFSHTPGHAVGHLGSYEGARLAGGHFGVAMPCWPTPSTAEALQPQQPELCPVQEPSPDDAGRVQGQADPSSQQMAWPAACSSQGHGAQRQGVQGQGVQGQYAGNEQAGSVAGQQEGNASQGGDVDLASVDMREQKRILHDLEMARLLSLGHQQGGGQSQGAGRGQGQGRGQRQGVGRGNAAGAGRGAGPPSEGRGGGLAGNKRPANTQQQARQGSINQFFKRR